MNIGPSNSTLQAFGNTLSATAPTAQSKAAVGAETSAAPTAKSTQRADAAPRPEAPARAEASASTGQGESARRPSPGADSQRAAKIDILV